MPSKQRTLPWTLTCLVLGLTVLAWAQTARVGGVGPPQPHAHVQVTQTPTVAVCGDSCDCGGTGVAKESAPCNVQSSTGSCSVGSGECCVCAAANTVAVCGDTCDCSAGSLLTKVSAPCDVTSSVGPCNIGSGECCVCITN